MRKIFPASLNKLHEMLRSIREEATLNGLNDQQSLNIELAVEEALVNIISYGYPNRIGAIEIHCSQSEPPGIKIVLKDTGIPYDPLSTDIAYDPNDSTTKSLVGGYGVLLIRNIMDVVEYHHEAGCNILTLIKYR